MRALDLSVSHFHFMHAMLHLFSILVLPSPCGAFFIHISHSHSHTVSLRCVQFAPIRIKSIFQPFDGVWWLRRRSPPSQVIRCPEKRALHKLHKNSIVWTKTVLCNRIQWILSNSLLYLFPPLSTLPQCLTGYQISARVHPTQIYTVRPAVAAPPK